MLRYSLKRLAVLAVMLLIGMYLVVIVLNFGGYIDTIHEGYIDQAMMGVGLSMRGHSMEEIAAVSEQLEAAMRIAYGLDQPFLLRCVRWTYDALTLHLGDVPVSYMYGRSIPLVRVLLLDRLPYTLLLFGVSNLVFFVASFLFALFLYRKHGSFLDRLIIFISPISSIPSWIYGVFLVIVFSAMLHLLPFPRGFTNRLEFYVEADLLTLLKFMILPVTAIFLNMFFQSAYSWRTFFLLQAGEDYLELAKAKGLPDDVVERRYLVRPSLPYILTTFAMTMIGIWQSAFVLEKFFFWPGIGSLFFDSIGNFPITAGVIVLFAYLLVATIFLLEIVYALVDPRIRLESRETAEHVARREKRKWFQRREKLPAVVHSWTAAPPRQKPAGDGQEGQPAGLNRRWRGTPLRAALQEIRRYPSAVVGLVIIAILFGVSIYTVIAYPYRETLERWHVLNEEWRDNPTFAQPAWSNLFRERKLPQTIVLDSRTDDVSKMVEVLSSDMNKITLTFPFDYPYGDYPQDLVLDIEAIYAEKAPMVSLVWVTPDGRELPMDTFITTSSYRYSFDWENHYTYQSIVQHGTTALPWEKYFNLPGEETVQEGAYQLRVEAFVFEPEADLDVKLVIYGQVFGLAGTDDQGRDLKLAVLWGTPFALVFGLLGAFGTGVLAMTIAAMSIWFGGWVDTLIQRITEINLILPALPLAMMIYFLYTHNIWIILGVIILLSVFGNALKNYRAAFLQVKESGYVQAAQVYGASNRRIILRYLVPRIIPLLVPQLVALVPSYIFLEPTLAFLGVTDAYMPTWGKILMTGLYTRLENDQIYYMTLMRDPYLALQPIILMFITGLAFSLLGMALDRIFNPRLRSL